MKKLLLLGVLCAGLVSCGKEETSTNSIGNPNASSFGEMKINQNFDWETSHAIQLNVAGLSDGSATSHFLTVSDPDGKEIYKLLTTITSDHKLFFDLADQYKTVTVKYGSISKEVQVKNRKANFDYTVVDDRSDLDPADR